eukprot:RCo031743
MTPVPVEAVERLLLAVEEEARDPAVTDTMLQDAFAKANLRAPEDWRIRRLMAAAAESYVLGLAQDALRVTTGSGVSSPEDPAKSKPKVLTLKAISEVLSERGVIFPAP